jgi:hypothetical protein
VRSVDMVEGSILMDTEHTGVSTVDMIGMEQRFTTALVPRKCRDSHYGLDVQF